VRPSRGALVAAWTALAALALAFALAPGLRGFWRIDRWLTWRDDYTWLFANAPIGDWVPDRWGWVLLGGAGVTAVLMAVAAALTLALLIVTPRRQGAMTVWGSRTLYVYLLHGPVIWVLRETGAIDRIGELGVPGVLAIVALGIALAVLLSMSWVTKAFRAVVEPRFDWVLRRS
jgi:hypothetical protein